MSGANFARGYPFPGGISRIKCDIKAAINGAKNKAPGEAEGFGKPAMISGSGCQRRQAAEIGDQLRNARLGLVTLGCFKIGLGLVDALGERVLLEIADSKR